jgi:DNA processing protein
MAERLAAGLVRAGFTVVSGLARGIDGAAHRAALEAGGRTIAVLAGGLSRIYPPEHADLADQVAARGALVTETPMTVQPQPGMFPARNRIISGLSRGVVIVEAGERSGALITATHAAEQGREVFAVPGQADSPASAGCLELIRKGVRLVRSVDDILEDLRGLSVPSLPPARKQAPTLLSDWVTT